MHFVLLTEQPYDSIPNFSAADALRLTGIGRNEFIDIMNKCRSKVVGKCTYMLLDIDNIIFSSYTCTYSILSVLATQFKLEGVGIEMWDFPSLSPNRDIRERKSLLIKKIVFMLSVI